jgi:hypothetical protein
MAISNDCEILNMKNQLGIDYKMTNVQNDMGHVDHLPTYLLTTYPPTHLPTFYLPFYNLHIIYFIVLY